MASITKRGKGSFTIQFVDKDGRRKSVSLSRTNVKNVQTVATRIECINAANRAGHPVDGATADWLSSIGDVLAKKLANAGLIEQRNIATMGDFVDEYIKSRTDWKPLTKKKHAGSKEYLFEFFPRSKPLRDVTEGDADDFARFLKNKDSIKSEDTRAKHVSNVRSYFEAAVRRRIIAINPFGHIRIARNGDNKKHFVTPEEAAAVLEACPNNQWRMLFSLSRYGGLRMVSEVERLEWDHVLWDQGKILIHSPKTEHHPGKDKRFVPLFPELREYLAEGLELAPPKTKYVITSYRKGKKLSSAYIRKHMTAIIERAGIVPWPKLFNSCRSTRETELENQFSIFTVCKWLGNSPKTFKSNYHQVTEDDFKRAAGAQSDENDIQKMLHQMLQSPPDNDGHDESADNEETGDVPLLATMSSDVPKLQKALIFLEGLEPPIDSL